MRKSNSLKILGLVALLFITGAGAALSASDDAEPEDCGWCDDITWTTCSGDDGHYFWAIHATYNDEAFHGYHADIHCGHCSTHAACSRPGLVQQKIEEAMKLGPSSVATYALSNRSQLRYQPTSKILEIRDCDKDGTFYSYRLSADVAAALEAIELPAPGAK